MFKFEVGQKFEMVDPVGAGFPLRYKKGDVFTVDYLDSNTDACDSNGVFLDQDDIDKGYVRIITDEESMKESIENQNKMNEALNEVHTKVPETMANCKENAKEFLDNYDKARDIDNKDKPTPRDLACFDQVASVIGEEAAEQELAVVIGCADACDINIYNELEHAFLWHDTPQDYYFWDVINKGRNPYECLEVPMATAVAVAPEYDTKDVSVDREKESTGGSVGYYKVKVENPTTIAESYEAECNDIIEALEMNYAEGNAFKAIWRKCAARKGKSKKGYTDGLYDAEKVVFFGERMVEQCKEKG